MNHKFDIIGGRNEAIWDFGDGEEVAGKVTVRPFMYGLEILINDEVIAVLDLYHMSVEGTYYNDGQLRLHEEPFPQLVIERNEVAMFIARIFKDKVEMLMDPGPAEYEFLHEKVIATVVPEEE